MHTVQILYHLVPIGLATVAVWTNHKLTSYVVYVATIIHVSFLFIINYVVIMQQFQFMIYFYDKKCD